MMASEIFEFDAAWAVKWTKTGVPFFSAPTVDMLTGDSIDSVQCIGNGEVV